MRLPFRPLIFLAALLCATALTGCTMLGYYAHLAQGQWQVLAAREPIAQLIADPHRDPELRRRLALALHARDFASTGLALPRNGSYTQFADIGRPFVVWNVFAAPELSLTGIEHCFPIAGCVAYRGYYREDRARAEAARLDAQGLDTYVAGVPAYSTLGWFDDPLLNTLLRGDDDRLIATVFHELAHQQLYVPGDTAFNESYASFVEEEGLRQWRAGRGEAAQSAAYADREAAFVALVLDARQQLEQAYAAAVDDTARRAAKQAAFADLHRRYHGLKAAWGGWAGYDPFFSTPLNNAKLLPFGLYHQHVAAFAALFAREGRDWRRFHAAAAALKPLSDTDRAHRLQALIP